MTDTVNTPAFPLYDHYMSGQQFLAECGMTLLDYMAAKAMQGAITNGRMAGADALAKEAYLIADHMLKERTKWINK